jgi:glycosyltransferase involved in cell wall biosynthesis
MSASESPVVSVVIGSYNRSRYLRATLDTVRGELEGIEHEIIVVDGGSTDDSLKWLVGQKDVITIVQHNRGEWNGRPIERKSWGYFMNLAFRAASGKYICMLSDECLVIPGALVNGLDVFERAEHETLNWIGFYNAERLHEEFGDIPPAEYERNYYGKERRSASLESIQPALELSALAGLKGGKVLATLPSLLESQGASPSSRWN